MAHTSEKQEAATSKARYLVAVFSLLVVCIVAVLVVTVASQARNSKQQQIDDQAFAVLEQRVPRFINSTSLQLNESIILTTLRKMRVVTSPLTSNETTTTSVSSG